MCWSSAVQGTLIQFFLRQRCKWVVIELDWDESEIVTLTLNYFVFTS